MNKIAISLTAFLVLGTVVFGASAFTSAELDRQANIDVVADDQGLVTLLPGDSQSATLNSSGELEIDAAPGADGVNVEGLFTYGSESEPVEDNLFAIENGNGESFDLDVGYETDDGNNGSAVEFRVYDDAGTELATVEGNGTEQTVTLDSAETVYVVMEIDTQGLGQSEDLSGELQLSV